jgi:enamine deaminase RidA (YjgF/YER057c/UK114 family)
MTIKKINPETLARPHGFAQIVVATGSKIVYTSGQVGIDADYNLAGSDYRSQARRAAENVYAAITAAGGTPSDIVRLMVYVVAATKSNLEELYAGLAEAGQAAGAGTTTMTLIGVTALSEPGWLLELDATAVID